MSQLTSPLDSAVESILACVHCARSKAKCDRKVPCTRCVKKKLACQTRVPQRGQGQSYFTNRSNTHPSRSSNPSVNPDIVESDAASASATDGPAKASAPEQQTTHGIYMDWSHAVGHDFNPLRTSRRLQSMPDVTQRDDFIARFVAAAPSPDESYRSGRSRSNTFMPPGLLHTDEPLDFATLTRVPSPTTQMEDLANIPPWDLAFTMSTGTPTRCASEDDAMDDLPPTASSLPSLESGFVDDDDQVQALEGWQLFQCNPVTPSPACTPTAARHVKNLNILLKDGNMTTENCRLADSNIPVEPLLASTREKLIAVLQGLFNEAKQLYGLQGRDNGRLDSVGASVLVLPPPSVLEFLFRAYLGCCEQYYPFIPTASLKINECIEGRDTILPSMLLLLQLAAGALTAGAGEICPQIAHGLVEICRISLRNLIDQDIQRASDPEVLQCALLLIIVSVWSGDKWQMDLAIYQKTMFLEMHLRAGLHDHRDAQVARLESFDDITHCWEIWKEQERANRTTYSWLILDHEVCIFQDIPSTSLLSTIRLNIPIPSPDAMWRAQSAKHWAPNTLPLAGQCNVSIAPSLNEWVRWFSETNDVSTMTHVSPMTMRLLLCHLQDQVIQLRPHIDRIPRGGQTHKGLRHTSVVLLSVQVQEAQELLHKWYDLARTQGPKETASSATVTNIILYHLILLNTMVNFPEIERLARCSEGEIRLRYSSPMRWEHAYHLENTRELYFNCGQVLRNVRSIPEPARPLWWAGAVYRVALIAWATSMSSASSNGVQHRVESDTQKTLLLDVLPAEDATVLAYLNQQRGIPVFSDSTGATVSLDDSVGVIRHCARLLDTDINTKFTLGIQRKLLKMAHRWESIP